MREKIYNLAKSAYLIGNGKISTQKTLDNWDNSLADSRKYYLQAYRYFHLFLPEAIKAHRSYYTQERRGFGEDAFHTMWYLLYKQFQFRNFLEIGIYRGQTISLLGLLAREAGNRIDLFGISPFTSSGDEVSNYIQLDYYNDTLNNFNHFSLDAPQLTKAYSTDTEAIALIEGKEWDCIYIDGSHDYDVALSDWNVCSRHIKKGGIIVMDDASLNTSYNAPFFAFAGHPGPSQVANDDIDRGSFKEILRVGHNRVFQRIA